MRAVLDRLRPGLVVLTALALLAPPLLHNHPPAVGACRAGDDGGADGLVAGPSADSPHAHCPACAAGPAAAGVVSATPSVRPQLTGTGTAPAAAPVEAEGDARVRSARAPPSTT